MKCKQIQNRLNAYLDKELDQASELQINQHILSCHACQHELSALKQLNHQLEISFSEELNPVLISELINQSQFIKRSHSRVKQVVLSVVSMCFAVFLGTYISNLTFNKDTSTLTTSTLTDYDQQSLYAVLDEVTQ